MIFVYNLLKCFFFIFQEFVEIYKQDKDMIFKNEMLEVKTEKKGVINFDYEYRKFYEYGKSS